jgi:ATP-dependent helicase/nuclease subunit A
LVAKSNLRLPFEPDAIRSTDARAAQQSGHPPPDGDRAARTRAVDPRFNVALEASAGTGKTRVLVERYINLLRAGVDPANILAMTFTRKAATEMRDRILHSLRTAAERGEITPVRWRELQERSGDIAISTIDAFCLSLLREFPLEADLDPGFSVADDTEVPRLVDEALDRALRICRALARDDERVALVFAQLGERRARSGLAALLARRVMAPGILSRFLSRSRRDLTAADAASSAAAALLELLAGMAASGTDDPGEGFRRFVMSGPADPAFMLFVGQLERLEEAVRGGDGVDPRHVHATFARARDYFLRRDGEPRSRLSHPKAAFVSESAWRTHRDLVATSAPAFVRILRAYRHDINVLVAGGVWRMFRVAEAEYRRTLDAHAVLDFSDLLLQTLSLLRRMEEFARSRYRLESRYHHVLVDEFQDTSRAQWELVSLLVQSWGEGAGLAHAGPLAPSIFIVGDRKQSIYGFRDADVSVLGDAVRFLTGLRPDGDVRRSISRSFRSVAPLLAFVNDVCQDMDKVPGRADAFEYGDDDRFPIAPSPDGEQGFSARAGTGISQDDPALGVVVGDTAEACADATAAEIARLIDEGTIVRDSSTGLRRAVRAGDIAILFRTRESHRAFEDALQRRAIPSYVYKGLGFFDTDEIRDLVALLGFLAQPASHVRAAALLRSGVVRLSDAALQRLAPDLAGTLAGATEPAPSKPLGETDARALALARAACRRWLALVDRVPPAELLDLVLSESAYGVEARGARVRQARENVKKLRGLVRRAQNNGYATLDRIVRHLDRLAIGDESNAAIDALDAVNLMTVHAAKGLEFPVVFIVNLTRGTGGRRSPIRVTSIGDEEVSVSVGDYRSASDEDDAAVEREETKRLLYVALTRARDRLYLGVTLKEGRLQPARGSLGEVLPATLLAGFGAATGAVTWMAASGSAHTFRMVRPSGQGAEVLAPAPAANVPDVSEQTAHDFVPLGRSESRPGPTSDSASVMKDEAAEEPRLLGTLVHRLVHRFGFDGTDELNLSASAMQLLRAEETSLVESPSHVVRAAAAYYLRLCSRPDVRALYDANRTLFEVPFCTVRLGRRTRGVIDCLVGRPMADDPSRLERLTVVELKTGTPRPEHREQVAAYRDAARLVFPGVPIDTALVYPEHIERG